MEPDVSPFAPATAGPEWKDTVGRTAKDGETSCRSETCRGMPRCFGVPKLRYGTARAGRRLSAFASPYLVMQSGLRHRHSADFGWESRPEEYIKGRGGNWQGLPCYFSGKCRKPCFARRGKDNFGLECKKGITRTNSPLAFVSRKIPLPGHHDHAEGTVKI